MSFFNQVDYSRSGDPNLTFRSKPVSSQTLHHLGGTRPRPQKTGIDGDLRPRLSPFTSRDSSKRKPLEPLQYTYILSPLSVSLFLHLCRVSFFVTYTSLDP